MSRHAMQHSETVSVEVSGEDQEDNVKANEVPGELQIEEFGPESQPAVASSEQEGSLPKPMYRHDSDYSNTCRTETGVRFLVAESESEMNIFRPGQSEPKRTALRRSVSKWRKDELDFLNVEFDYKAEYAFTGLERIQVTPKMQEGNWDFLSFTESSNCISM